MRLGTYPISKARREEVASGGQEILGRRAVGSTLGSAPRGTGRRRILVRIGRDLRSRVQVDTNPGLHESGGWPAGPVAEIPRPVEGNPLAEGVHRKHERVGEGKEAHLPPLAVPPLLDEQRVPGGGRTEVLGHPGQKNAEPVRTGLWLDSEGRNRRRGSRCHAPLRPRRSSVRTRAATAGSWLSRANSSRAGVDATRRTAR